jgi:hypothetical protein
MRISVEVGDDVADGGSARHRSTDQMLTAGQAKVKRNGVIVPLTNPEVQPYFQ